jgi:hypothetical protein
VVFGRLSRRTLLDRIVCIAYEHTDISIGNEEDRPIDRTNFEMVERHKVDTGLTMNSCSEDIAQSGKTPRKAV